MNATAMRATSRSSSSTAVACRAAAPAGRASAAVAPLRCSNAAAARGSSSRRNTSSSSSKLNGAAVANASSKTLAVERVRSDEDEENELDVFEEFEDEDDGTGLTGSQVQSLLSVLCEETQLAELEVRLGSFELHVVRSRENLSSASSSSSSSGGVQVAPGAPTFPAPLPGTAFASTASMDGAAAGSASSASSATASFDATMSLDDDDAGVSTLLLGSPKVGLLRRGRYVKGKRVGKGNAVEEGAEVKKGQVLGYVEQLGTFMPIEAPQAGELVAFLVDEGNPVEYRQPVAEIAPFFGGHIIGDSKHA